jgi:general L-amino acid transport system substrate-binding protein
VRRRRGISWALVVALQFVPVPNFGNVARAAPADLVCGVASEIPGFVARDAAGRYAGFEAEFCRAVAVARGGSREAVRFVPVPNVAAFENDAAVDLVVGGLTASALRAAGGRVVFGPVYFHDGQHVVVRARDKIPDLEALTGRPICVTAATRAATTLQDRFAERGLLLEARVFDDDVQAWQAFERGECVAYSADLVEIVKGYATSSQRADYAIIPERLSLEPLAPVLHVGDATLLRVVRQVLREMVDAELRGDESAARLGSNYGQIYERTLGARSPYKLPRSENRLARDGGLISAPGAD